MEQYTIFCTAEQAKRALNLCAPLIKKPLSSFGYEELFYYDNETRKYYAIPTTQQMFGWLKEKGWLCYIQKRNGKYISVVLNMQTNYEYVFCKNEKEYGSDNYIDAEHICINAILDVLEKKL